MLDRYQISQAIFQYRKEGNLEAAVQEAEQGISNYPELNFFYKIKGDLLLEQRMFAQAATSYALFLEHLDETDIQYFKHFAKFWKMFRINVELEEVQQLFRALKQRFNAGAYNMLVRRELGRLLWREETETVFFGEKLIQQKNKDFVRWIVGHEKSGSLWDVYLLLYWIDANVSDKNISFENTRMVRNALYAVSVMEHYDLYPEAIRLVECVLESESDDVAVRTLFRICRKMSNYSAADRYLEANPDVSNQARFNIQYELFYYYLSSGDEEHLQKTLHYLQNNASGSIPISRTLQKFYVRLGRFDDALQIRGHISRLLEEKKEGRKGSRSNKETKEEIEAEEEIWYTLKDMISEQEHTRQLIAIKELLRGFSHELGQPITNIRYGIQLYQMKMERHMESPQALQVLLENVLKQTDRLHSLLKRFAPVVAGKNENQKFDCMESIRHVFDDMKPRLEKIGICYEIQGEGSFCIIGDPVRFDQIFYNLIVNSADALRNLHVEEKKITVKVSLEGQKICIAFRDTGEGIPKELSRKIFHPFFSTKSDDSSDSGAGLGLYIVWNVLKMYGGSIRLNHKYLEGAEFLITLPKGA